MKKLVVLSVSLALFSACTHKKVEVNQFNDDNLTCYDIAREVGELDMLKKDIDDKTGFSGRNVGMGIFFWPGVIVNEYNGSKATDLADARKSKLINLYKSNKCDPSIMISEQKRVAEMVAEKEKKAKEAEEKAKPNKNK